MSNCPDVGTQNAAHFNLPEPGSEAEREMRESWYRQAGVQEKDMDEDKLVFQALRDIAPGEEVYESCYEGKSELELLFYFGFVPNMEGEHAAPRRSQLGYHGDGPGDLNKDFLELQGRLSDYYNGV